MFNSYSSLILFMLMNPLSGQTFHRLGSKEYYVEVQNSVRDYSEAVEECARINSTLAIVNSQDIQDFLVNIIGNLTDPPYSFFIGLRRINRTLNTNDAFQWIDGTLLSSGSDYSNWRSGEPNNHGWPPSGEDCVTMGFQFVVEPAYIWIDGPCADSQLGNRYICESNINELIISTSSTLLTSPILDHSSPVLITMAVLGSVFVICVVFVVIVFLRRKKHAQGNNSLTDYDNKDQSNNTKREEPAMTYETVGPTVPEEPSKNQQTFNSSGQSSTHGQIAEDENGYVIANVKPKPENDNGYVQANVRNQPNVVDESGYAVMVVNHDKIAEDKDGYLTPKANHEKRIYVNETDYCSVGVPSLVSPHSNDGGRMSTSPTDSSGYVQLPTEPRDAASMEKKNRDDYENTVTKN